MFGDPDVDRSSQFDNRSDGGFIAATGGFS
jgi:hypothetical protein